MKTLPLIGITKGNNLPNEPDQYIQAVQKAGGLAEFIYSTRLHEEIVEYFDGFLIPGGKDIDPLLYNEDQRYKISREDPKRTDYELFLLREATKRGKPVLGICYGMQVINIFFGGSLYQDIREQKICSLDHRGGLHELAVQSNPFLKSGNTVVNSTHHQALKEIGRGLTPFAFADDGIVEGIYLKGYEFLLGVQWHPERMSDQLSQAVFSSFMERCHEST